MSRAATAETGGFGSLDAVITAIRSGPQGAGIGAVFDLSAVADLRTMTGRRFRDPDSATAGLLFEQLRHSGDSPGPDLLEQLAGHAAGKTPGELAAQGERVFKRGWYDRVYPEAWRLVREHLAAGHTVVLTGTVTDYQLHPVAAALEIGHTLGARPAVAGGRFTGGFDGPLPYGPDKAALVADFATAHGIDLRRSYVYSGSAADLPLLSSVGTPVPIAPDSPLAATAADQGWPRPVVAARTSPTTADRLRTVAGFAALLGGALFGVLSKAYTRDRRTMADALMRYGTGWPLRLCGIRLRVTGTEYARNPRPAVFLFNHQSQFDVLIVPAVLGAGVTGVGKKELIRHPIFGPLMRFVGVTFIDRSNTDRAKASLAPVVHTLRDGLSIAIAPEGTRSYTSQPGKFKKGAFHIAAQAGVPVIPVVIRNAADIGRRDSMIARPGIVDIAILPPIDSTGWDPADLGREVAAVRQRYLDTLRDWPTAAG
ncbi:1-acylglycerol-3-phosphate O-acyltransferase [Nocardia carnea]|uniref:1-acyl-sn-glycerol-3-phosphate acyltransferase n=1 Tax=Nocardia carnea TaxID=37328 RepID=A0ABW7TP46_9NOCA|nr:1-acylglycerol-3-phosphate O-acyltransferase [Nocardia carnea]